MAKVLVSLEQGQLKGLTEKDYAGRPFYSFHAIPYAKPPLGPLRFKAPQPPGPWEGVRDATKEPSECYSPHTVTFNLVGTEDCLYLNVYTPQLPNSESTRKNASSLPVMLFVHGGAFFQGSSKREFYSPEFLVMHDVILVTINYRLGLLGFLSFEDPSLEVTGNAGLKDAVMALKWVQKNIVRFSGNPNNVTVFGNSAGAAAVEYLTLSPLTKGLFRQAIIQSGSVLNPWATGKSSVETIAQALGADTTNAQELLRLLRELPVEKLYEVQSKLPESFSVTELRCYGPVVEPPGTPGAFLTEYPLEILTSGKYNKIPIIFLYTKEEAIVLKVFITKLGTPMVLDDFQNYIPRDLNIKKGSEKSKSLAQAIKDFYFKGKEPTSESSTQEYYNLETDSQFLRGLYKTIRIRLRNSDKPIFFCRFSLDAGLNHYKLVHNVMHLKGASHADELGYLFKSSVTPSHIEPESVEGKALRRLTKLWTNFAKYGSPTVGKDPLIGVEWIPTAPGNLHYLEIDKELSLGTNPDFERITFWDEVYKKYGGQRVCYCSEVLKKAS